MLTLQVIPWLLRKDILKPEVSIYTFHTKDLRPLWFQSINYFCHSIIHNFFSSIYKFYIRPKESVDDTCTCKQIRHVIKEKRQPQPIIWVKSTFGIVWWTLEPAAISRTRPRGNTTSGAILLSFVVPSFICQRPKYLLLL